MLGSRKVIVIIMQLLWLFVFSWQTLVAEESELRNSYIARKSTHWGYIGESHRLFIHENRLYAKEIKSPMEEHGGGFAIYDYPPAEKSEQEKQHKTAQPQMSIYWGTDDNGQVILVEKAAAAKWSTRYLPERSRGLSKSYGGEGDEIKAFEVTHHSGVHGNQYLTLSDKIETIELVDSFKRKQAYQVQRIVLTSENQERYFLRYNDYSGK